MHQCLKQICREFEQIENFLSHQTPEKEEIVQELFIRFIDCFSLLKEEKFEYPKEFQTDVKLYKENYLPLVQKFNDKQIQYLMLSDFYDFVRLTKRYKKE